MLYSLGSRANFSHSVPPKYIPSHPPKLVFNIIIFKSHRVHPINTLHPILYIHTLRQRDNNNRSLFFFFLFPNIFFSCSSFTHFYYTYTHRHRLSYVFTIIYIHIFITTRRIGGSGGRRVLYMRRVVRVCACVSLCRALLLLLRVSSIT